MALSLLRADPAAPAEAAAQLARVLEDYDRGSARLSRRSHLMHVQIVTFTLDGLDHDGYRAACAQMTQAFAAIPGHRAKIWLSEPATGTYGGVYLWDDRASMEAYAASELFATVASSPAFAGIVSRDFEVLEDLTLRTQPGLDVLAEPAASV